MLPPYERQNVSENWKIQVSPKLPDGTLVNIRAESSAELTELLQYVSDNAQSIVSAPALLAAAMNVVKGTQPATPPAQQQSSGFGAPAQQPGVIQFPQQGQAPAPVAGQPQHPGTTCEHGLYVWKDFMSKQNNHIKGFFCPANFRTECKAEFRK